MFRAHDGSIREERDGDLIIGRGISVGSPGTISGEKEEEVERGDDCSSRSLIARSDHGVYHVQGPSRHLPRTRMNHYYGTRKITITGS